MARTLTQDPERVVVGAPHHDNTGLRARLSGLTVEPRSIEAELRAAMQERTSGEIVVEVPAEKRWR
jgi:hypothetical protein